MEGLQHPLVVLRRHLDELRDHLVPVVQDAPRHLAPRVLLVTLDHPLDLDGLGLVLYALEVDHLPVAAAVEVPSLVQDVGDAARHAGGEVPAGMPQHHHAAAGHVLAAVVAHRLHHGLHAAVPDAEPLAGHATDECLALGGAVQGHVPDDDVLLRHEGRARGRVDGDLAAGEPFADVVVGIPFQSQGDPLGNDGSEALAGRSLEVETDRVFRQPFGAVAPGYLAAQDRSHSAVDVPNGQGGRHGLAALQCRFAQIQQYLVVQCLVQTVVLGDLAVAAHLRRHIRLIEDSGVVQPLRLVLLHRLPHFQALGVAYHLVHRAEAEPRHQLAHLLCDVPHEVDDVLGLAGELSPQLRVLGGHTHRAGIQVAYPHLGAAHGDQGRG